MTLLAGLTENGFIVPTFEEVRADVEADYKAKYGESINTRSDSVFGMMIDIAAERELVLWQEIDSVYNSQYASASGTSLDQVLALTGVTRLLPAKSTSKATITGTGGTVLPPGRVFSVDSTGARWVIPSQVTIPGGGSISDVAVESEDYGAINALATDTFTIETQVSGWTAISLDEDATLGNLLEKDSEARVRRDVLLRALGSGSLPALAARLTEVDGVTSASVAENDTDATVGGLVAHSLKAIVQGGTGPDIAQAIFDNKPIGIATNGTQSEVIVDQFGNNHTIKYDRPTSIPIFVDVDGTKDATLYPSDGDTQISNLVVAAISALEIGDDVYYLKILSDIIETIPGLLTLTVELGLSEGTETVTNITIDFDEIATISAADIDILIT